MRFGFAFVRLLSENVNHEALLELRLLYHLAIDEVPVVDLLLESWNVGDFPSFNCLQVNC